MFWYFSPIRGCWSAHTAASLSLPLLPPLVSPREQSTNNHSSTRQHHTPCPRPCILTWTSVCRCPTRGSMAFSSQNQLSSEKCSISAALATYWCTRLLRILFFPMWLYSILKTSRWMWTRGPSLASWSS
jgi:hypothetical protein